MSTLLLFIISAPTVQSLTNPTLINNNKNIEIREIASGLSFPSDMEIIDNDILVTQKYDGKIKLIRDLDLKKYAIYDAPTVPYGDNSGLMGISSKSQKNSTSVFLYFTQQNNRNSIFSAGGYSNGIFAYVWNASGLELSDQKLIFEIPVTNTSEDYSGSLETDPDNLLYLAIGDLNRDGHEQNGIENRELQNTLDDTSETGGVILRIASNGTITSNNPFSQNGFKEFFAYGIKHVGDFSFDPVSKNLWYIVKGPNSVDEINMIKSGFNNGWKKIHGYDNDSCCPLDVKLPQDTKGLSIPPNSHYDEPKFAISNSSNLTAVGFMHASNSNLNRDDKLYVGDMQGNLFQFGLDKDRENIFSSGDIQNNLFAKDFGPIVDLEFDDKGVLYVLTYSNTTSSPYREQSGSVYALPLKEGLDRLTASEIIVVDSFGILWILISIILMSVAIRYKWIKQVIKK